MEQISDEPRVPLEPLDPKSPTLPCLAIQLGRTKTGVADEARRVLLVGPPVEALREWLERGDIAKGIVFRAIDRWEGVEEKALTPQSINLIVNRRCALAGLEAKEFSAHGLSSGVSDQGRPSGRGATGSHAAVAAPFGSTSRQLLQRGGPGEGQGGKAGALSCSRTTPACL